MSDQFTDSEHEIVDFIVRIVDDPAAQAAVLAMLGCAVKQRNELWEQVQFLQAQLSSLHIELKESEKARFNTLEKYAEELRLVVRKAVVEDDKS